MDFQFSAASVRPLLSSLTIGDLSLVMVMVMMNIIIVIVVIIDICFNKSNKTKPHNCDNQVCQTSPSEQVHLEAHWAVDLCTGFDLFMHINYVRTRW